MAGTAPAPRRDTESLVRHGRAELSRDVQRIRREIGVRAERTIRGLETRVVKELHAATTSQLRALPNRIDRLERAVTDLDQRLGALA